MSEKVVSLRGKSVASDAKTEFLTHMGQAFEEYIQKVGVEPGAVIFVLASPKGLSDHWCFRDPQMLSHAGPYVAMASAILSKRAIEE